MMQQGTLQRKTSVWTATAIPHRWNSPN